MEAPTISVVIPSYNMSAYIQSAICSVLGGEFANCEVLVVDDGSIDNTPALVKQFTSQKSAKYDDRVRYFRQENAGKSAALNRVLGEIRGEYVAILDADDQLPPNGLVDRYSPVDVSTGEAPELVIGGFEVFREEKRLGQREAPSQINSEVLSQKFFFSYKTPFHLNSCLIDRSLLERVGLFDERLKRAQDQDYSLRLLSEVGKIAIADSIVYRYRKYRAAFWERVRYRLKNLRYRPQMVCKHTSGIEKVAAVTFGGACDLGKLLYEIGGSYHD